MNVVLDTTRLAALVALVACSRGSVGVWPDGGMPDDVEDRAAEADAGTDDSASDAPGDAPPDPSRWCPSGAPIPAPPGLIPAPRGVFQWGDEIAVGTVSVRGADAVEAAEVAAMAAARGLDVAEDGALRVEFHPTEAWSPLADACAFAGVAGSYYLAVSRDERGAVASIFAPDAAGRWYALKTLKQLIRPGGPPAVRVAQVVDHPAVALRGVIEGFYGEPWSDEDRLALLPLLSDLKFNVFAYAPKGDWAISALWKAPLSEADAARIRAVVEAARRQRMRVCWEVRPVLLLVFSSEEDFQAMLDKFRAIRSNGADCLILAFDDTEKLFYDEDQQVYDSYVEGLVDFANRLGKALRAEMPEALLVFVPRDYWWNAPDAGTDLAYLGAHLDPVWEVAWTGNDIVSATITAADAEAYGAAVRRKPFLGDNFPVTDDARKTGVLNLGPLTGRSPDLATAVSGIAYNASPLVFASLLGLATAADFAWNPQAYDPERSLLAASVWVAGEDSAWAVEVLGRTNQVPPFSPSAAPELDEAVQAYWVEYESGAAPGEAAAALERMFTGFAAVPGEVDSPSVLPGFVSEVRPWAEELGAWGDAGLLALDLLAEKAAGGVPDPASVSALAGAHGVLTSSTPRPTGDTMPGFIARTLEVLSQ